MQLAQEFELGGGGIDEAKFESVKEGGGEGRRSNTNISGTTGDNAALDQSRGGILAVEENMVVVVQKGKDIKDSSKPNLQQALAVPMKIKKLVKKEELEGRVRYRECLRNHVASLGGQAMDGCGEFIPSCSTKGGEEGSMQCGACGCHRNFHRQEVSGEEEPSLALPFCCYTPPQKYSPALLPFSSSCSAPPPIYNQHLPIASNVNAGNGNRQRQMQQMLMSFQAGSNGGSEQQQHQQQQQQMMMMGFPQLMMKKRFRTKFSNEQKEKMLAFAEKLEWRIQKQDEGEVQQFCMEEGIKRHVLKVWMHNNKHTLGKKL